MPGQFRWQYYNREPAQSVRQRHANLTAPRPHPSAPTLLVSLSYKVVAIVRCEGRGGLSSVGPCPRSWLPAPL